VDGLGREARALALAQALVVQVRHDGLDAQWTVSSVAMAVEVENEAQDLGLGRVDLQAFLDLVAAPLGLDHAIADRRPQAVPETLAGVLLHGAERVLGVLRAG